MHQTPTPRHNPTRLNRLAGQTIARRAGALCVALMLAMLPRASAAQVATTQPASTPGLAERVRLVDEEDLVVVVLENGMTAIVKAGGVAPVVATRMYVATGSIYEQEYLGTGISHLFEHLLSGGTTERRTEEESKELMHHIGGSSNAYTTLDHTCYYIGAPAAGLERAIELLADWVTRPTFPQDEFDREWGVVQRELEMGTGEPNKQLWYLTMENLFKVSPTRYPTIGYQSALQTLQREDIIGYYQRMYVPDNVVFAVAGDLQVDIALDAIKREFADFTARPIVRAVLPDEPAITAPRTVVKHMDVNNAMVNWSFPTVHLTSPDLYPLDVLAYILGRGESARLVKTLRDRLQLVHGISVSSWTPHWGAGALLIRAQLKPENIEDARAALLDELDRTRREPVSAPELAKAKQQTVMAHIANLQTAASQAEQLARDVMTTGNPDFSKTYIDNINQVTSEQVLAAAQRYVNPQRLCTAMILPNEAKKQQSRSQHAVDGGRMRKLVLPSGLTLLLQCNAQVPLVSVQIYYKGGLLLEDDQTNGIGSAVAAMLKRGTTNRTAEQIAEQLDAMGSSLSAQCGYNTLYLSGQCLSDDFAAFFDVFADVITNPTFPDEELEKVRPRLLAAVENINNNWRSELMSFYRRSFFETTPYRLDPQGSSNVVANVSSDTLRSYFQNNLVAQSAVLAIVGDIDPDNIVDLVQSRLAEMPSDANFSLATSEPEPTIKSTRLLIKRVDKPQAGVMLGFRGVDRQNDRDRYPLQVLDTISSGYGLPSGWLHTELRGKSLVYVVHAMVFAGLREGYFGVFAGCQPENANQVVSIILDRLNGAIEGAATADELALAKTQIIAAEILDKQTNADVSATAALDELYGLGYDYSQDLAEQINRVTLDEVRRVAREYLTHPIITVTTPRPEDVTLKGENMERVVVE